MVTHAILIAAGKMTIPFGAITAIVTAVMVTVTTIVVPNLAVGMVAIVFMHFLRLGRRISCHRSHRECKTESSLLEHGRHFDFS
jgi:type III secretory pathway component EscU